MTTRRAPAPRAAIPHGSRAGLATFGAVSVLGLVISGFEPRDWWAWWLEALPVVLGLAVLSWTHERFPLTALAYGVATGYAVVLLVGAHYTFPEVPFGAWLQQALGLPRNPWGAIGQFGLGFVAAILGREILLRCTALRRDGWLVALVLATCLAVSAAFEVLEWAAVLVFGDRADLLLGARDAWDTQRDLVAALLGAGTALAVLHRAHDRSLAAVLRRPQAGRGTRG
jgi:putative membrane protein